MEVLSHVCVDLMRQGQLPWWSCLRGWLDISRSSAFEKWVLWGILEDEDNFGASLEACDDILTETDMTGSATSGCDMWHLVRELLIKSCMLLNKETHFAPLLIGLWTTPATPAPRPATHTVFSFLWKTWFCNFKFQAQMDLELIINLSCYEEWGWGGHVIPPSYNEQIKCEYQRRNSSWAESTVDAGFLRKPLWFRLPVFCILAVVLCGCPLFYMGSSYSFCKGNKRQN